MSINDHSDHSDHSDQDSGESLDLSEDQSTDLFISSPPSSSSSSSIPQLSDLSQPAMRAAVDVISRMLFFSQNGLTSFNGQRDLYNILGYKRNLTLRDYKERYRRGGIAKRIVKGVPEMAWAGGADIIEDENPEVQTELESDVVEIFDRLGVIGKFRRMDILAGQAHYSVGIIGVKDGKDLSRPLEKLRSNNQSQIIFLTPVHEENASIKDYVEDSNNERFGLPLTYEISFSRSRKSVNGNSNYTRSDSKIVHWTRVIHHLHEPLDDDVFGTPDLEDVWNDLDNLYKLIGGGSEAAWKQMVYRTLFDIDKDVRITQDGEVEKKEKELQEMIHGLRQFVMTRGVTPKSFGATVYDFSSNANTVMQQIAGTKGLALRVLMGTEEGTLAGDQDRENVKFTITQWCDHHAIPLVRQFVDRLVKFGFVRPPKSGKYQVSMGTKVADMTESDRADLDVKYAQANKYQFQAGQPSVLTSSEIRDRVHGLKPMDAINETPPTTKAPVGKQS